MKLQERQTLSCMANSIKRTDLNIIKAEEGSVLHFIKNGDIGFKNFGEVYFSTVNKDFIKVGNAQENDLNLVVPVGRVLFHFIDGREDSKDYRKLFSIVLSQNPYFRLTVPPMYWFGFKGLADGFNLISNQADLEHDPEEVERNRSIVLMIG